MLGPYASQAPNQRAPELKVVIDAGGSTFESTVVRESYAGIWPDSDLRLSLHGDAPLAVRLVDDDGPGMNETVLESSIGARQLLSACRPVCLEANYGAVCLALERAP